MVAVPETATRSAERGVAVMFRLDVPARIKLPLMEICPTEERLAPGSMVPLLVVAPTVPEPPRVAPVATVTDEPERLPSTKSEPAEICVEPVKPELFPVKVTTPEPSFVN